MASITAVIAVVSAAGGLLASLANRIEIIELVENRDYPGSSHFFFDVGNGNLLAFFDLPGLDLGPYAEVLGGLQHLAISVTVLSLAT